MSVFKKICICTAAILLCYGLPAVLHPFEIGVLISPIHIPVIICALACGPGYGFACAIIGPIFCSILTGMPELNELMPMLVELSIYAVIAGLTMRVIHTGSLFINIVLTLVPTILLGRAAGALAVGIFYALGVFGIDSFSLGEVVTLYFTDAVPTIAMQMTLIPLMTVTLKEEKVLKF